MGEKQELIIKLKSMGKSDLEISQLLGDYSLPKAAKYTSNSIKTKRGISYVRK